VNKLQADLYALLREDIKLFAEEHHTLTVKDVYDVLQELLYKHEGAMR